MSQRRVLSARHLNTGTRVSSKRDEERPMSYSGLTRWLRGYGLQEVIAEALTNTVSNGWDCRQNADAG